MNSPEPADDLRELCNRLLDGNLSSADRVRLESLVRGEARLCELYVELMHEHVAVQHHASMLREQLRPVSPTAEMSPAREPGGPSKTLLRWLAIAAAVVATAGIATLAAQQRDRSFADLVEATGARWSSSSLPTAPGSKLGQGRLRLDAGVARIVFRSGAEVRLEGPAELELVDRNGCFLHAGVLTAHVPEQARGFRVGTTNAQLIDHGTDFALSAQPDGAAQARVLNGLVELRHERTGQSLRLGTRESARVTAERFLGAHTTETEATAYPLPLREEPYTISENTVILSSAAGRGDAVYVVSPNSTLNHSNVLLLLKNHSTDAKHQRKAYVRFDLQPLGARRVIDAALTLNFESTGLGYASLTDACTFAVYGVTDESQDEWQSETLRWETAPAFSADPGAADVSRATQLGKFVLPRGVVSGSFGVSGEALARFLNTDRNRLATLIVVRETVLGPYKAAHGFAGNRHPALAPPTLKLVLEPR
jgi:hypothetical protein